MPESGEGGGGRFPCLLCGAACRLAVVVGFNREMRCVLPLSYAFRLGHMPWAAAGGDARRAALRRTIRISALATAHLLVLLKKN